MNIDENRFSDISIIKILEPNPMMYDQEGTS